MKTIRILSLSLILSLTALTTFAQANKYAFQYKVTGTGDQVILFIPGFGCSADVWQESITTFEKNYTCYALTMAGFAGVEATGEASFQYWSSEIVRFLDEEKINSPIIVGHSMGGALAMDIASTHSDKLKSIVIVDALPCLSALMNPAFESEENIDCTATVDQITSISDDAFREMQKMGIARLLADEEMHETVIQWSLDSDRETFAKMYCDFSNVDLREKIKGITCPSLVLLEAPFNRIKEQIEAQFKALKPADLRYADKGLHFIMFDNKEWYMDQLNHFFSAE